MVCLVDLALVFGLAVFAAVVVAVVAICYDSDLDFVAVVVYFVVSSFFSPGFKKGTRKRRSPLLLPLSFIIPLYILKKKCKTFS